MVREEPSKFEAKTFEELPVRDLPGEVEKLLKSFTAEVIESNDFELIDNIGYVGLSDHVNGRMQEAVSRCGREACDLSLNLVRFGGGDAESLVLSCGSRSFETEEEAGKYGIECALARQDTRLALPDFLRNNLDKSQEL